MVTIREMPGIGKVSKQGDKVIATLTETKKGNEINRFLYDRGIVLNHIAVKQKSLENQFLEIVSDEL